MRWTALLTAAAGLAVPLAASAQSVVWLQRFDGPSELATGGPAEDARAIVLDAQGNIIAGGVTQRFENVAPGGTLATAPHDDIVIIKYSPAGDLLWSTVFDFPTEGDDQSSPQTRSGVDSLAGVIALPDGGVIATGRATSRYISNGLFGLTQAGTVRLGPDGEVQWHVMEGDIAQSTIATALASDGGFGAFVGGTADINTAQHDAFITRYDGAGVPVWSARAGFPAASILQVLADGPGACVALAGVGGGGCKVVRVSSAGEVTSFDVPAFAGATGIGLAPTPDGGVVAAAAQGGNLLLARLDAAGQQTWSVAWRPMDDRAVTPRAIALAADGLVRVAGHVSASPSAPGDFFLTIWSPGQSQPVGFRTLDAGLNQSEMSARTGVTIEPSGRTLVAGNTPTGVIGDADFAVAAFELDATLDWSAHWAGPAGDDRALAVAGLPQGVVALGRSEGGATGIDMATLALAAPVRCDTVDFNRNGVFPEDQDVIDFFAVLSGASCDTCGDIDFNNNAVFPEDQDVIDFFAVLSGAPCA